MSKSPLLPLVLACGCAISPLATSLATTPSTAPWVSMAGLPGSDAGRIAFDPNNPNTMFVGPTSGGGALFRSTNGGTSFTRLQVGGIDECFRAMAVDPKKNSGIVFAFSSDNVNGGLTGGIYESTNSGVTWTRLKNQPIAAGTNPTHAGRGRGIVIDPTGTYVVAADSKYGIFYSNNLGASWTNTLTGTDARVYSLAVDPKQTSTIWAGGYDVSDNYAGVLWKSTDFGKTWTKVPIPVLNQNDYPLPLAIAVLPNSNTVIFTWAGNDPASGNPIGGVVASKDGGSTWTNSSAGLPSNFDPGNAIAVDTQTPTTIFLSTNGTSYPNSLFRSTDSGASWTAIGNVTGGGDSAFTVAARPAASGVSAAIFAGDQDLIRSTDHGASWSLLPNGTNNGVLRQVQDDLLATGGIYAQTYNGLFHSANNGQSWTRISSSWTKATVPVAFAVDPVAKAHTVYAATETGFWRSGNAGTSWTASALPAKASVIQQLVADKAVSGRVYAVDSTQRVYRSDNSGQSWNAGVAVGASGDAFVTAPSAVLPDPSLSGTLYAGMGSGVWKSANSDTSWTELKAISGLASITAVAQPSATEFFAVVGQSSPSGFSFVVQKGAGGGAWSTATAPYQSNGGPPFLLMAAPTGTTLFAFNFDSSLVRSTDLASSWGVVDGPIESSLVVTSAVSATASNIYVGDQVTDAAFTAPLAKLTAPSLAKPSHRTVQTQRSAIRPAQLARHVAE